MSLTPMLLGSLKMPSKLRLTKLKEREEFLRPKMLNTYLNYQQTGRQNPTVSESKENNCTKKQSIFELFNLNLKEYFKST